VKIGHGGTLDPLATGVLITGVGKGTKSLQDFLLCTKVYECVVLFGTSTDTYDRVGKVLRRAPYAHVTKELVEEKLEGFRGKYMQLPPLFSALKMNGKPLYEYAREGKAIPREIERRPVEVLELEMLEWMDGDTHNHKAPTEEAGYAEINVANKLWKQENVLPASGKEEKEIKAENPESKKRKASEDGDDLVHERPASKKGKETNQDATMSGGLADPDGETPAPLAVSMEEQGRNGPPAAKLRMVVTSGFYVRSLCHDLGAAVGSAALMAELQRTRQEEFELGKNVLEYEDLEKGEKVWGPQVESMLDAWYDQQDRRVPYGQPSRRRNSSSSREGDGNVRKQAEEEDAKKEGLASKEADILTKTEVKDEVKKRDGSPVLNAVTAAVENVAKAAAP
jgi:tRNA pseudouridine55 synthase